jgi:hypothetical protein
MRENVMAQRTIYTKYREKMGRLVKQYKESDVDWIFFPDSAFEEYKKYFLNALQKEVSFPLYHYCNPVHKERFNLNLESLYLTRSGCQNDIFEGVPNSDFDIYSVDEYIKNAGKLAYLKCFCETPRNNLMWAHYANSFRGISIEYDICKLQDRDIKGALFPVYYSQERIFFVSEDCIVNQAQGEAIDAITDAKGVFLQKADYWKYEREWRICYMNQGLLSGEDYIEKPFPCVSAIYLGPKMERGTEEKALNAVADYERNHQEKVRVYKMEFDGRSYKLHPREIE